MAIEGGALAGIRVLDLTEGQAGPACTQLLGMLGADVINVEQPGAGSRSRVTRGAQKTATVGFYHFLNANKRGVTINLKTEGGKAVLTALIEKSDVLVENFGPGAVDRLGFGWERLHQINPRLVYASIKGFGSRGPYSKFKGQELIAQASGGAMFLGGTEDTPPMRAGASIGDSGTGVLAVGGILAALIQRQRTGVGQFVDVSMQDAILNLSRLHFREHHALGRVPVRGEKGLATTLKVGEGLFACAPGGPNDYVVVSINPDRWDALLEAIGRPDLIAMAAQAREISREQALEHAPAINGAVSEWAKQRTKHEAMCHLGAAGLLAGAVNDTADLMADEHLLARDMIVKLDDPNCGEFTTVGNPLKLSNSHVPITRPPMTGEHTVQVLTEVAGLSEGRIAQLRKEGAI